VNISIFMAYEISYIMQNPLNTLENTMMQDPKFHGLLMVNILGHENKTWFFMVSNVMSF